MKKKSTPPSFPRINISINTHPRCSKPVALETPEHDTGGRRTKRENEREREWWGGTPVNRYKISSAIFPGKFSAAIVKRRRPPPPPRVFIAKSICETRVRGHESRVASPLERTIRAQRSVVIVAACYEAAGGGNRRERRWWGGGDDPSALSAYHRVLVGLVRYATAWSETTPEDPVRNQFRETAAAAGYGEGRGWEEEWGEGNGELSFRNLA